jgi:hypothetical protein
MRWASNQEAEWVAEVDRVHEAAVLHAAVLDAALVEALDRLAKHRVRHREGDVVDVAGVLGPGRRIGRAPLVGEDRDQPAVARVEVEVALLRAVQVGLLEDERHPQHTLPEIDRGLPIGAGEGDVVDALGLQLAHVLTG